MWRNKSLRNKRERWLGTDYLNNYCSNQELRWYYLELARRMRFKMDEFQNSLVLWGRLRDPFNFLGSVFPNKLACCCSCRKVQLNTLILRPPSPPRPPLIFPSWPFSFDISAIVLILCSWQIQFCIAGKWQKNNKKKQGELRWCRDPSLADQGINIFSTKKHGTANILIKTDDGWERLVWPCWYVRVKSIVISTLAELKCSCSTKCKTLHWWSIVVSSPSVYIEYRVYQIPQSVPALSVWRRLWWAGARQWPQH